MFIETFAFQIVSVKSMVEDRQLTDEDFEEAGMMHQDLEEIQIEPDIIDFDEGQSPGDVQVIIML